MEARDTPVPNSITDNLAHAVSITPECYTFCVICVGCRLLTTREVVRKGVDAKATKIRLNKSTVQKFQFCTRYREIFRMSTFFEVGELKYYTMRIFNAAQGVAIITKCRQR